MDGRDDSRDQQNLTKTQTVRELFKANEDVLYPVFVIIRRLRSRVIPKVLYGMQ